MSCRWPVRAQEASRQTASAWRAMWEATCPRLHRGSRLGARQSSSLTEIVSPEQSLGGHRHQRRKPSSCSAAAFVARLMRPRYAPRPASVPARSALAELRNCQWAHIRMTAVTDRLVVRGAREHNLRNISLDLPRDALIVFTGLSGSGKSSLAFDTIFAEGQRRYVESLSAYARQFLGQMDKPDVDFIEGLSPAVSIDQKSTSRNPRSTVGTITEVYDYLRLLFARAGRPHCPICGEPISRQSPQQIVDRLLALPEGTRFQVLAPVVRGRKGEYVELFRQLAAAGFSRARVDGEVIQLVDPPILDKKYKHSIDVDRRPAGGEAELEAAADRLGRDRARSRAGRGRRRLRRPRPEGPAARAALLREDGLPERPRHRDRGARAAAVLVQRAVGRLPGVLRAGHPDGGRPRAGRPRRREEPVRGGHRPVGLGARRRLLHPADRLRWPRAPDSAPRCRGTRLPAAAQKLLLYGVPGPGARDATRTATAGPAATTPSTRASSPTSSVGTPRPRPTPPASGSPATCVRCRATACHGARLKPTSLAVTVGDRNIAEIVGDVDRRGRRLPPPVGAHRSRAADRRAGAQGDQRATQVPARRRPRLPVAEPADGQPLRR